MAFTIGAGTAGAADARAPAPQRPPQTTLVVDNATGETLIEKDSDRLVHPASLTKMMTLFLVFEALEKGTLKLDQKLAVSADAASLGTMRISLKLKEKQTITVEQAIYGLTVQSANDASIVLAEAVGGSQENFVKMMNAKAKELGMTGTVFMNPHGLPNPDQVTTARDMVTLSQAHLKRFSQYQKYFETKQFTYKGCTYSNHNHLLGKIPEVDFGKTGYVDASGYNLALSAKQGETRIFAVTFGDYTKEKRDSRMEGLLKDGFEKATILAAQQKPAPVVLAFAPVEKIVPEISASLAPIIMKDDAEKAAPWPPRISQTSAIVKAANENSTSAPPPKPI